MKNFFPDELDFQKELSPNLKLKPLRTIRVIGFVFYIGLSLVCILFSQAPSSTMAFYTIWGIIMTGISCGLSLLSTYLSNESAWHKVAFVAFEIAFTSEIVITIFFWLVLSWFTSEVFKTMSLIIFMLILHAFPVMILAIDFVTTKILFLGYHLIFIMIPPLLYMILSLILAFGYNIYVYEVLTWKDGLSVVMVLLLVSLFIGSFIFCYFIGKKVFRRNVSENSAFTNTSNQ